MNPRQVEEMLAGSRRLRLLLIEDNEGDAALLERHLTRGGFQVEATRVESAAQLAPALAPGRWDLVISDFVLPGLGALEALTMVRAADPDLPFIVVSGLIGEEPAVDLMRMGANDYVMKDRLARLVPAIERELLEAARHREQRRMDRVLEAQYQMVRVALKATGDGVWDWNPQTGATVLSDEFKRILGFEPHEFPDDMAAWRIRVHPDDLPQVERDEASHYGGGSSMYRSEYRVRCRDGSWKWVLDRGTVIERDSNGLPIREVGTLADISAIRRREAELSESHAVLRKLARQAPGVLYQFRRHADGRMDLPYVSEAAQELWGLTSAQLLDSADAAFAQVDAEDLIPLYASIDTSARGLIPWSHAYRIHVRGRGVRWMHGEAQPELLADGSILWHGFIRDITEQREAEAELRLLQTCINQVNDAVVVTAVEPGASAGPRIVYVNPAFERQTGYRAEEVIGRTPRLLQGAGTDAAELKRIGAALHAWQPVRAEVLNYRKDGSPFWTELAISPVADRNGSYTHWVSVQRDTSVRKQSEAEREHLIRELEKRNSELDTYNHSVAHDLRNPVISIRGMADLAAMAIQAGDPVRAGDCIARIARSADQADTLIRNLMELAKLGKRAIRPQPLPARAAFEAMRASLELQIAAADAQVSLDVPDAILHTDPLLLQMIFSNLVGNALKHRHPDRAPRVAVALRESERPGWHIEVRDNGIGIHPQLHDRVFRLFERVDDRSEGTGVGLALVDRAARLLEGEVRLVHSAPGHGSCFAVWLPAPGA